MWFMWLRFTIMITRRSSNCKQHEFPAAVDACKRRFGHASTELSVSQQRCPTQFSTSSTAYWFRASTSHLQDVSWPAIIKRWGLAGLDDVDLNILFQLWVFLQMIVDKNDKRYRRYRILWQYMWLGLSYSESFFQLVLKFKPCILWTVNHIPHAAYRIPVNYT